MKTETELFERLYWDAKPALHAFQKAKDVVAAAHHELFHMTLPGGVSEITKKKVHDAWLALRELQVVRDESDDTTNSVR